MTDDELDIAYDPAEDFDDISTSALSEDDAFGQIVEVDRRATELGSQYAVLGALKYGIDTRQKAIGAELSQLYAEANRSKGTVQTPYGSVAMAESKESNVVVVTDEQALLDWAAEHSPAAVLTTKQITDMARLIEWLAANMPESLKDVTEFAPGARAALLARFAAAKGKVIDIDTKKELAFATVKHTPAGPPSPQYSSTAGQQATKMAAAEFVDARMPALITSIRAEIAAPGTTRQELEAGAEF